MARIIAASCRRYLKRAHLRMPVAISDLHTEKLGVISVRNDLRAIVQTCSVGATSEFQFAHEILGGISAYNGLVGWIRAKQ
jgi:hypothetical protein